MIRLRFVPWLLLCSIAALSDSALSSEKAERGERLARRFSAVYPWHGNYYHTDYGRPVALVVPPTARMANSWSWGVAQTEMRPIWHQFGRAYPGSLYGGGMSGGGAYGGGGFSPTPVQPSHTDQFGVYPIRGPW